VSDASANRRAVIVAGDSHSGGYDGRTWADPATGTEFVGIAANIDSESSAGDITRDGGKAFNPLLLKALDTARAKAQEISAQPPLLVLALAGSDYVMETADLMWREYDFIHPDMPQLVDRSKRFIQYEIVKSWLDRRLAPYEKALDLFDAEGMTVSGIVPPPPAHRSNRKFMALLMVYKMLYISVAPFPIRGKMGWMARCYLRDLATRRGIAFIDTWTVLADGLFVRPEYEFDGLHISQSGAQALLRVVAQTLSDRPGATSADGGADHDPVRLSVVTGDTSTA
jgi:lysophospholipase L1-like esterase